VPKGVDSERTEIEGRNLDVDNTSNDTLPPGYRLYSGTFIFKMADAAPRGRGGFGSRGDRGGDRRGRGRGRGRRGGKTEEKEWQVSWITRLAHEVLGYGDMSLTSDGSL
jgi:hypothetical protein